MPTSGKPPPSASSKLTARRCTFAGGGWTWPDEVRAVRLMESAAEDDLSKAIGSSGAFDMGSWNSHLGFLGAYCGFWQLVGLAGAGPWSRS
eukprot:3543392-Amphidinium_carterae.1